MQTAATVRSRFEFPAEGLYVQRCDDCGRIATEFIPGEHFGCFRVADLWLCDDCARTEIARRVKYPPRGACEECKCFGELHPMWTWYSSDYSAGTVPSRFLCANCKERESAVKYELQREEVAASEALYEEREEIPLSDDEECC